VNPPLGLRPILRKQRRCKARVGGAQPRLAPDNSYRIYPCTSTPTLTADWSEPGWRKAETLEIRHFRPESSRHRPCTRARLLYDRSGLHGIFQVDDQYVRCRRTNYLDPVYKDSAVEFFVQPMPNSGYINFEFNCGGTFLCYHITDPTLVNGTWKRAIPVPPELGKQVQVKSSLPQIVEPEITVPIRWRLQFFIPFAMLEAFVGPLEAGASQIWRGNFFKCASEISHPHWAAWSPVDEFNFHLPRCFGWLLFAP
jgi:hypothetical protein